MNNKAWIHILTTKEELPNIDEVNQWLINDWNLSIKNIATVETGFTFKVGDLADISIKASTRSIDQASYSMAIINNYTWANVYNEKDSYSHDLKVTFEFHEGSRVDQYKLLSKVVASILKSLNHCIAVYVESAIMVIDRGSYIERVKLMNEDFLPVDLWIYIGIGKHEYDPQDMDHHFAFTYGFHSFDKKEIEVLESKMDIGDLYSFFGNIVAYILTHDYSLADGHLLVYPDHADIEVKLTPGSYLSGDTFKLKIE
jgi:hypothetical protein